MIISRPTDSRRARNSDSVMITADACVASVPAALLLGSSSRVDPHAAVPVITGARRCCRASVLTAGDSAGSERRRVRREDDRQVTILRLRIGVEALIEDPAELAAVRSPEFARRGRFLAGPAGRRGRGISAAAWWHGSAQRGSCPRRGRPAGGVEAPAAPHRPSSAGRRCAPMLPRARR